MKKNNKKIISFLGVIILILTTVLPYSSLAAVNNKKLSSSINNAHLGSSTGNEYKGVLRIYIVEIESRWKMDNKMPYHFALFDIAFENEIKVRYLNTYEDTLIWNGDVEEDNVIVMAALFNPEGHKNYADPPDKKPFTAHYVDAAAAATPGNTGFNTVNDAFTHTVFMEEGTASWCPACPGMASKLENIYESGDYPFYYVAMVVDKSNDASRRMNDYNLYWLPTAFYEGGKEVLIGGDVPESAHRSIIEAMGQRDVHELNMSVSVEWLGEGELRINVSITNLEETPNSAPDKPRISGPSHGKKGTGLEYTLFTIDPDGDDVFYCIDWDDGSEIECFGPYHSGEEAKINHTWDEEGTYVIKAMAKDLDNAESDWEWFKVIIPRSKLIDNLIDIIIEKYPSVSKILQKMIEF